jgi:uncharacterized glyoxalase superfamily metalloenzyme YdcJ
MSKRVETWELRARFAAALSRIYGAEVPAYTTLVEVSAEVNRELDASERVTAERHGAIRVGSPRELAEVADLFAAFGMYPVGFYDLRDATSPVPVVSTAFRPIEEDQLARNPFRVFTSMLATSDPRFFPTELRGRVERFVVNRKLFDPALIAEARRIADDAGADPDRAERFVAAAVATFALSREPIDRGWYEELSRVSAVAADIAGVATTHINHLTPRVLDIDELYRRMTARGITMIDAIQGPPRWLRQTRQRCGATTFLPPTRAWRPPDWPITTAGIRRNRLSTRTSCRHRRPVSSGRISMPTRRRPNWATIRTTAPVGWPVRSGTTFTIRTSSTRKPHHHDHCSDIPASDGRGPSQASP